MLRDTSSIVRCLVELSLPVTSPPSPVMYREVTSALNVIVLGRDVAERAGAAVLTGRQRMKRR